MRASARSSALLRSAVDWDASLRGIPKSRRSRRCTCRCRARAREAVRPGCDRYTEAGDFRPSSGRRLCAGCRFPSRPGTCASRADWTPSVVELHSHLAGIRLRRNYTTAPPAREPKFRGASCARSERYVGISHAILSAMRRAAPGRGQILCDAAARSTSPLRAREKTPEGERRIAGAIRHYDAFVLRARLDRDSGSRRGWVDLYEERLKRCANRSQSHRQPVSAPNAGAPPRARRRRRPTRPLRPERQP